MDLAKKRTFLYRLFCLKEFFVFNICVLFKCIVYWIQFQNIHTCTHQKTLLYTLLLLVFKIVESLECILNRKSLLLPLPLKVAHIYLNFRTFDKAAKDCCNEFSKSVFWERVEEFLFKWIIISLAQQHFQKRWKKSIAKKYLIACTLPETEDPIDSFQADVPSPYPLKTFGFWYFLIGYKEHIGLKWVNPRSIFMPELTKDLHQWRIQEWSYL